jgi:hypothetical protein
MIDYNSVNHRTIFNKKSLRPKHLSKNSNLPYYKEIYAIEIREVFDKIIETKKPYLWKYSEWSEYKPTTLYQRVCCGAKFLIDHLDPDGKYSYLRDCVDIGPVPNSKNPIGLGIRFKRCIDPETMRHDPKRFMPKNISDLKEVILIIDDYLQDSNRHEPLDIPCVLLLEHQEVLINQYAALNNVIMNVDSKHIKIVKLV